MLRNSASSSSTSVRIVALVELPLFAHVSCDDVCVGMEPGCVALCSVSAIVHVPQQGIPPMILVTLLGMTNNSKSFRSSFVVPVVT